MKRIAFFDFDGTLTDKDSLGLFAIHSVGLLNYVRTLLFSLPAIIKWKVGLNTNSDAKEMLLSKLYKGKSKGWFESMAVSFVDVVDNHLNKEGMKFLMKHIANKDEVCVVTASPEIWVTPWALRYGINNVIGTELEFDNKGNFTGRFLTPNCHGKEKPIRIVQRYPDLLSYKKFAYSDSESDAPMLDLADEGILI